MNKFNKGKNIGIISASLAAVALVGVGFSTWIIQTTNTQTTGDITVTVADTKDISIAISDAAVSDGTVKFDANKDSKVTGSLLTCGESDAEDMSFTITYKVTVGSDAKTWQIKAGIEDGTDGKFNTAVNTRKYIALPTTLGLIESESSDSSAVCLDRSSTTGTNGLDFTVSDHVYTVKQTFTFTWGDAFAKKNPVAVTASDDIYTQSSTTEKAKLETLTANTKAMKTLGLSTFKVTLSVGTVSLE